MRLSGTKIGDVFVVEMNDGCKKYFQYIASDTTQLNSDVIRTFKRKFEAQEYPGLEEIANGEVEFYAHCITKLGLRTGHWKKIGNTKDIGELDCVLFRSSSDYGNPEIKVSCNWWVWKINQEQFRVGELMGDYQRAEIGLVFSPEVLVNKIKYGDYGLVNYPGYKNQHER